MWSVGSYKWIDADYHITEDLLYKIYFKMNKNHYKRTLSKQSINSKQYLKKDQKNNGYIIKTVNISV